MEETLKQDLIHRLVPFLVDMRRNLEADWATGFTVDETKSIITVYGKRPGRPDDKPIQLCAVPVSSFNRFMRLNPTRTIQYYAISPLTSEHNTSQSSPAHQDETSPAAVIDPPKPPSATPEVKPVVFRRASPTSTKGTV